MAEVTDGKRLERWRMSLPRATTGSVTARALALALGWEQSRWRQLERKPKWSAFHRQEVERGVRGLCDRLELVGQDADRVVAHVLDGAPAPELRAWRDGMCPAIPMGRPLGTRPTRHDDDGDDDPPTRPILPEQLRRRHVTEVLRALVAGEVDERTASEAIGHIYEPLCAYYNKTPDPDTHAA